MRGPEFQEPQGGPQEEEGGQEPVEVDPVAEVEEAGVDGHQPVEPPPEVQGGGGGDDGGGGDSDPDHDGEAVNDLDHLDADTLNELHQVEGLVYRQVVRGQEQLITVVS